MPVGNLTNPIVSVVVPVHNGERFLGPALDSVLGQDYTPLEVLVVDDGSIDGSADLVRRYDRVRYLWQANQGVAVARNRGILASRGEILAFLDQDDLWRPRKLSRQVACLQRDPGLGYVLAWQHLFTEPDCEVPAVYRDLVETDHVGYFPGTLVARRWAFDRVGLYTPHSPPAESADWFARATDEGLPMAVIPEVLLHKRLHRANQSRDVALVRSRVLRALKASAERRRRRA